MDLPASQLRVDALERVELVLERIAVLRIEEDLEQLAAVLVLPQALADDFGREDEVLESGFVNGLERSRPRSLLLGANGSRRFADHTALSDEDDAAKRQHDPSLAKSDALSVGELLLELTSEAARVQFFSHSKRVQTHRPWILW